MAQVEPLMQARLAQPGRWRSAEIQARLVPAESRPTDVAELKPELASYDALLHQTQEVENVL